jgi:hypothetical protein
MQFEELGFILVSKDFLRKIFNIVDDEKDIQEFGKEIGITIAKEMYHIFILRLIVLLWFSFWIIGLEGFSHVSI